MNLIGFKDDFSKSEFELSGESSNDLSDLDAESLAISNLDLDDDLKLFKYKNNQAKKQQFENKQLQHDLQMTKIDLAQRDYQFNNLRIEHASKVETLEEKCADLTHQNQMLNARLNSLIAIHQEEDKQKQDHIKLELSRILVRQKELEENNERFMRSEHEMKKEIRSIDTLNWTNEQYEFMSRRDEDLLTIKEFTALKFYNSTRPLKIKLEETLKQVSTLENQLETSRDELSKIKNIYEKEKHNFNVNSSDNQKLYYELADTKALLQQANFKRDNYDRIKYERDDLERKYNDSQAKNGAIEATMLVLTKERDDLIRKADQLGQEISLLRQDKEYLQKQFVEAQTRYKVAEDKLDQTQKLYDETKRSKDDLYEKHMNAREAYKSEYEMRLTHELDDLKIKTNQEIEKLRTNTKEFYEREIRNLKEVKEMAIQEKEKHELNEKELNIRYQEAVNELRIVQMSCENKVAELKSELKLKKFELERCNMLNEENINMYQKSLTENEKLNKKIEIIQNEYYHMQVQNDKRTLEIENELNEKKSRLESYEKVENEMDTIIRQVAESSETGNINETEAEKVLSSYGYGANIVLNSKRRIQQNVHLTKRILHLEQLNTALRLELNKERNSYKDIVDQLEVAKSVLDNSKQPHEYLVRSMQAKELQLKKQQSTIEIMQKKIDELSSDREALIRKQNDMATDIEKLIRHNEELFEIREELKKSGLALYNRKVLNSNSNLVKINNQQNNDVFSLNEQPKPMMFTSKHNRLNEPVSPKQRYKIRKSPELINKRPIYSIEKN